MLDRLKNFLPTIFGAPKVVKKNIRQTSLSDYFSSSSDKIRDTITHPIERVKGIGVKRGKRLRDLTQQTRPKENKELKTLIPEAERLTKSGYVGRLRKSLLKSELAKKEIDVEELKYRISSAQREEKRVKKEVEENARRQEEQFLWRAKQDVQSRSKDQIKKELQKIQIEQDRLYKKRMEIRPDERTQRKARLENQLDGNAIRMRYLQELLERYEEVKTQSPPKKRYKVQIQPQGREEWRDMGTFEKKRIAKKHTDNLARGASGSRTRVIDQSSFADLRI